MNHNKANEVTVETSAESVSSIKAYYGKILKTNQDLKTSACCSVESMPAYLRNILPELHEEVCEKFYGCGSPIPLALEGKTVLDLGCGSGRDCYILAKLVGPRGRVIGIDMTDEQIAVAQKHLHYHTHKFGYQQPNITFIQGYIEDLASLKIADASIDVVVSNCVINLSPDKQKVFSEIFRVLKPGGELYFSDVFSTRRISKDLTRDAVLLGECLGGALYIEDFRRLLANIGCHDFRFTAKSKIAINDPDIMRKIGLIEFYSMTIRAFKLDLEDRCEDHGQVAVYLGTETQFPFAFRLDDHHVFETGKLVPVCGNTASMLKNSRYSEHFKIIGDDTAHFGLFACGPDRAPSHADQEFGACC